MLGGGGSKVCESARKAQRVDGDVRRGVIPDTHAWLFRLRMAASAGSSPLRRATLGSVKASRYGGVMRDTRSTSKSAASYTVFCDSRRKHAACTIIQGGRLHAGKGRLGRNISVWMRLSSAEPGSICRCRVEVWLRKGQGMVAYGARCGCVWDKVWLRKGHCVVA